MKTLLIGLTSFVLACSAQAGSKEQNAYCKGMADIAGFSADAYSNGHLTKEVIQTWVYQLITRLKMDEQAASQAYAAMDFGIKMSKDFDSMVIMRYQYAGCLATI